MKNTSGVFSFLQAHASLNPVSFHMPGHKGSQLFKKTGYSALIKNIADYDITEIPGADNLFQTEGIIKETADKYRSLYDTERTFLLINGSSAGIIAAILASVPKGGKLIMARNCHKSVFNALNLGNITPVYAYPSVDEELGVSGPTDPGQIRELLEKNKDASAVILPSPDYYGVCSDIEKIAGIVHEYDKILIVDQAHGAHLKFFEEYLPSFGKVWSMPRSAESSGADIVINSTHKTLASFTQSAIMNVCSEKAMSMVNILENKLQSIESTSPSYILMASLDANADIISEYGRKLFTGWRNNIRWFYHKVSEIEGLKVIKTVNSDTTKINLDMSGCGISGNMLEDALISRGIYPELVTGNIVMCMSGIGNTKKDYKKLYSAVADIASGNIYSPGRVQMMQGSLQQKTETLSDMSGDIWQKQRELRRIPADTELINISESAGRVCAMSVIPYPPGIPLVCPGEVISTEDAEYIAELRKRGEKVIGIDEENRILTGIQTVKQS